MPTRAPSLLMARLWWRYAGCGFSNNHDSCCPPPPHPADPLLALLGTALYWLLPALNPCVLQDGELRIIAEKCSSCHKLRAALEFPPQLPLIRYNGNVSKLTAPTTAAVLRFIGGALDTPLLQPHAAALRAVLPARTSEATPATAGRCAADRCS